MGGENIILLQHLFVDMTGNKSYKDTRKCFASTNFIHLDNPDNGTV
jgi:hypothetical protein